MARKGGIGPLAALPRPLELDQPAPSAPSSHGATASVDSSTRAAGPDAVAVERKRNAVTMPRVQAVGNDQPEIGDGPRTVSGKRPTAASLQLQHEYLDWDAVPPSRDDVVKDYDAFMAERRETAERERLQQRAQKRKEARHARGLLRKPAGQGARYGLLRPGPRSGYIPLGEHRGGSEIKPNSKRQLRFAAQRQRAADHVSPKRSGRPIDPNSKRQRDLAARQQEAEAKAETERKLSQMTPAELEAYHREQHDLEVKRATVLNSEERLRSEFQKRLRHLRSVELRKYVPLERREEVLPSPPSSPPPSTRPPSPPPRSPPPSPPP